jgi:hypothetical protein
VAMEDACPSSPHRTAPGEKSAREPDDGTGTSSRQSTASRCATREWALGVTRRNCQRKKKEKKQTAFVRF